jgi:coenzyme F420-dependent glucose-6-phosphate dehydrogenase
MGYDHIYFHQIGPNQDGFFEFYEKKILPELR